MNQAPPAFRRHHLSSIFAIVLIALAAFALSACGNSDPVDVAEMSLPPTWTPTPYQSPTPVPPTDTPIPPTPVPTDTPVPEPTATPMPIAAVIAEQTVLRAGPGETFEQIGTVKQGGEFLLLGKDESGGWWQIRVNQQPVWVIAADVEARNAEGIVVAQDIPEPPATATPEPATNTPIPPTPRPTARPTDTPVPVFDPCANIGGDGCKFRITGGPAFAANGGGELRLTLAFVHGGRGDEAQGSYRVILSKNGVELPTKFCDASSTGSMNSGPNGPFNHDCKLSLGQLPDGAVAGRYTGFVIDGNQERDSRDFAFDVPDGQGEVWIKFDQG